MDREIDSGYKRKKLVQRILLIVVPLAAAAAVFIWGPELIRPSIARDRVRTARVEKGSIEAAIAASGLVVPEFEQVLSSPVNARVLRILKRPGATVSNGDSILQLDLNESVLALEKLGQQIEIKQNQQSRARLDLENTLINLENQWEIKNLEYKSARAATARNQELFRQGLLSEERLSEIRLAEEKTRFELKQLEESKQKARQLTRTQLDGLALEMKTLEGERAEARRQLELATTKADRSGVLTWVVNEEGATVGKGAVLARIADLSTFRVEATVSDVHAGRIAAGQPAVVRINEQSLSGTISRINPAVNNGVITLFITLDERSSPLLRSNLRVDVSIITDRKNQVLKIRKGPFAGGEGLRDVFVIRGNTAIKTSARFGVSGAEHYEVVQGLLEGDEVIISDMSDYQHTREVRLKQ
ncbi:MAG: HlyD family efflux transporter periplasmic adaptor subunit [Acidobacteriota bacterium]|nr:MAG: HlyD family efflux transporter periplasmic adaptor subunit [Acidobacteriota bacterium]